MAKEEHTWPRYRCGAPFSFRRKLYAAGEEIRFPDPPAMHMQPLDRAARFRKWLVLKPLVTQRADGRRAADHVRIAQIGRSLGLFDAKSMGEIHSHIDKWMADVAAEMRAGA